jgi:TusA-related sulfurtransferase
VGELVHLDVRGLTCSDAVVRLHKTIGPLPRGGTVIVLSDDQEVVADLRKYAKRGGHTWAGERAGLHGILECEVRRGE